MNATTSHETEITVDPDVPLVRIIREFDAPPEKVFRAHADPDLFARWCGPNGTQMNVEHMDCRTGGSYRYLMSDDSGEYGFRGCFHDVRPNELIIQTFTFEGQPDGVALEKLTFGGPGRRPHPADLDVAHRFLRGPRRLRGQRDGGGRRPGLPAPRRGAGRRLNA